MDTISIDIVNPKALQLIKGMQALNLIKVKNEPASNLKNYLKKMRKNSQTVPDLDEISEMVNEVRSERYAKK